MHRSTIVAGAVLAVLALAGCGRQQAAAGPPNGGGGLAAYVMTDTAGAGAAGAPATPRPGECSKGRRAYQALVFLVSSDTGTSVQRITEDLRAGRSLDDVAGAKSPEVRAQAVGLVQARLRFARPTAGSRRSGPGSTGRGRPPSSTP